MTRRTKYLFVVLLTILRNMCTALFQSWTGRFFCDTSVFGKLTDDSLWKCALAGKLFFAGFATGFRTIWATFNSGGAGRTGRTAWRESRTRWSTDLSRKFSSKPWGGYRLRKKFCPPLFCVIASVEVFRGNQSCGVLNLNIEAALRVSVQHLPN